MAETDDRWLSVDEICKHLGVSKDTVYKWIDKHGMPAPSWINHALVMPRAERKKDIPGLVYEYFLAKFAEKEGKGGGDSKEPGGPGLWRINQ